MLSWIETLSFGRRAGLAVMLCAASLGLVAESFWRMDWQYSLPTPRPAGLQQPPLGAQLALPESVEVVHHAGRPLLLHFANPKCPCTAFNLDHVRELAARFGDRVDVVTVIESAGGADQAQKSFEDMQLRTPMIWDRDGAVLRATGVYGTPQAALLDGAGRLYYRGNYNRSRYCLDESTEFVRLALDALVRGAPLPPMPQQALITYGCPVPRRARVAEGSR